MVCGDVNASWCYYCVFKCFISPVIVIAVAFRFPGTDLIAYSASSACTFYNPDLELQDVDLGFAIGNGLTDPAIQYKPYTDYASDHNLITKTDYENINTMIPEYEKDIQLYGNYYSVIYLDSFAKDIMLHINAYTCYFAVSATIAKFLNLPSVKEALGVHTGGVSCSKTVYSAMQEDWMKDLEVGFPALLEDEVKVMIYAGEYNLICNWLGNSRWVHAMKWSGQKNFARAPTVPFSVAVEDRKHNHKTSIYFILRKRHQDQ
ncbi:hypothetical protein POM88_030915 [Heracleum sosnowskyi]|uniref:Uncharacterized protein n=1 Tax=Heracleum sosnowskyi TaxID=360622 RepID=A0AAD8HWE8_9APIA|nr:hypothetical protein POM88_030915 [Heracleum sosnowskyi]